jgi:hypothetical protein
MARRRWPSQGWNVELATENIDASGLSVATLVAIIAMQNEIARSSIGFESVMQLVVERAMVRRSCR